MADAAAGADNFTGYEVAIQADGTLILGRHRHNYEAIWSKLAAWRGGGDRWVALRVRTKGRTLEVAVDGEPAVRYEDTEHPLAAGRVGFRAWDRAARFRNFSVSSGGGPFQPVRFSPAASGTDSISTGVCANWSGLRRGDLRSSFALAGETPFPDGRQQQIAFEQGTGETGILTPSTGSAGFPVVAGWTVAAAPTLWAVGSLQSITLRSVRRWCGPSDPGQCGCRCPTPGDEMQTNVAAPQHTAHQPGLVRFAYRSHPFYGQEVRVIRRLRTGVDAMVIVQGEPDLRIVAPCWMLEECCCAAMVVEECGRISVEALLALRGLIDDRGLLAGGGREECDSLMVNKETTMTVSLRMEAAANTITPSVGSTKGMTLRAVTKPAI